MSDFAWMMLAFAAIGVAYFGGAAAQEVARVRALADVARAEADTRIAEAGRSEGGET